VADGTKGNPSAAYSNGLLKERLKERGGGKRSSARRQQTKRERGESGEKKRTCVRIPGGPIRRIITNPQPGPPAAEKRGKGFKDKGPRDLRS